MYGAPGGRGKPGNKGQTVGLKAKHIALFNGFNIINPCFCALSGVLFFSSQGRQGAPGGRGLPGGTGKKVSVYFIIRHR